VPCLSNLFFDLAVAKIFHLKEFACGNTSGIDDAVLTEAAGERIVTF
jgi:hypothetical protein